jgi:hypothetical protein
MRLWKRIQLSSSFTIISLALVGCAISDELPREDIIDDLEYAEVLAEETDGASEEASAAGEEVSPEYSVELVMKDLRCGDEAGFPTWTFWGETTVQFVNHDSSGATRIDAIYRAGIDPWVQVEVHNQPVIKKGRWAGATLWVTYVGYYDQAGTYHACDVNDPAPALQVKTW